MYIEEEESYTDVGTWVTSAVRKQRVEVSLKNCTPEDRHKFYLAKQKEIGNWKKFGVLKVLKKGTPVPDGVERDAHALGPDQEELWRS